MNNDPRYQPLTELEQIALTSPFPISDVEWVPKATKGDRGMGAAYASKWAYVRRLNILFPGQWESAARFWPNGEVATVGVGIRGNWKWDSGEAEKNDRNTATSSHAQAFKRACAQHGLGLYFYSLPSEWADLDGKTFTKAAVNRLNNRLKHPEGIFWHNVWNKNPDREDLLRAAAFAREAMNDSMSWQEAYQAYHQGAPVPIPEDAAVENGESDVPHPSELL